MKIVIAGGTGFLGREIINSRKENDDEIIVLTRTNPDKFSKVKNLPENVLLVYWDPENVDKWIKSLENSDVIINLVGASLASGVRWTKKVKRKLIDSRVIPTKTLVKAINSLKDKPKQFIQISGINYYNFSQKPLDETGELADNFLGKLCEVWEYPSSTLEEKDIKILIIRLAPVLSKKGMLMKLLLLPYKLFIGGRYGLKGDQYFSWVHWADFSRFIDYSLTNNLSGIYNLSAPNPVRNRDMNRVIGQTLKRPWFFPVPSLILKILLGEKSDLLLKSVNVIPKKIMTEESFKFTYEDFTSAFKNL